MFLVTNQSNTETFGDFAQARFPVICTCFASFPTLATGCSFSRAWHRLLVFLCVSPFASFPALDTSFFFFLALAACYSFSRFWHRLLIFPCLTPVARFTALGTGFSFSRAWHRLQVFPPPSPVACLLAVSTGCTFLLRILIGLLRLLWLARSENFRFGVTKVANFLKANRIVPVTSLPESWKHLPSFQRRRPYSGVSLETAWTRRVLTPAIEIKFEVRRHSFCSVHWSPWEGHRVSSDFPLLRVWKVKGVSSSLWNVMC